MAVYFLHLKTFGRSGGSSAVSAAAYRSGERIRDERTGRTYDHTDRQDVLHKEILVPSRFADSDMGWTQDRANLWNAAENAEPRKNARVAREYLVALPVELDPGQRLRLARGFSQELTDRYEFALDLTIHAPRDYPGSDPRNFHAHLLATTRAATPAGLAAKTSLEWNDDRRREAGMGPAVGELLHVRERWADVTNQALREAQVATRVDHRTLAAQGIDREPYPYLPRAAFEMERQGYRSGQAEWLRANYEARVQARRDLEAQLARAEPGRAEPGRDVDARRGRDRVEPARELGAAARDPAPAPQSPEDVRRQARENWLKYRQAASESAESAPARSRDDGLSL